MIYNLINAIYFSFLFYVFYSVFHRVEIYIKKSTQDGTHSESYKTMYSKYLKSNRILMAIMMGCFRFAEDYTNTIFSMAIGIVVILCLKPILKNIIQNLKGICNIFIFYYA